MFGIFGRNIPSAGQVLSPLNYVGFSPIPANSVPYNYTVPGPVVPTVTQPTNTYYADYRNYNFGNPLAKLNTTQTGVNPGIVQVNKLPVTLPTQNTYNWTSIPKPVIPKPVIPKTLPKVSMPMSTKAK